MGPKGYQPDEPAPLMAVALVRGRGFRGRGLRICRLLPLTCLAPDFVEAILDGRQPKDLMLATLLRGMPVAWEDPSLLFIPSDFATEGSCERWCSWHRLTVVENPRICKVGSIHRKDRLDGSRQAKFATSPFDRLQKGEKGFGMWDDAFRR